MRLLMEGERLSGIHHETKRCLQRWWFTLCFISSLQSQDGSNKCGNKHTKLFRARVTTRNDSLDELSYMIQSISMPLRAPNFLGVIDRAVTMAAFFFCFCVSFDIIHSFFRCFSWSLKLFQVIFKQKKLTTLFIKLRIFFLLSHYSVFVGGLRLN